MKTIECLRHLEEFGIVPLTGEADNLGFRCLCDLTAQGKRVVEDCYGVTCTAANWNHGAESNPHVASVMIPFDGWQAIAIVALASTCHTVLVTERSLFGLGEGESFDNGEWTMNEDTGEAVQIRKATLTSNGNVLPWPQMVYGKIVRIIQGTNCPHRGTRNVHAMSGRSV